MISTNIELTPFGPPWLEVLVAISVIALAVFSFWSTRFQPGRIRAAVTGLRSLMLGLGFLMLHQPTFINRVTRPQETRIAVVTDRSGSMQSIDGGAISRYERSRRLAESLGKLPFETLSYEFDQVLYGPFENAPSARESAGNKTDLYQALTQLFNQSDDLSGVILFSDGHDLGRFTTMSLEDTENWLGRLGAPPVHSILVGQSQSGPEIAIHSLEAPAFSYVRAPLRIRATVMVRELESFPEQVQLMEEGRIVQVRDVTIDDQGFGTVDFEFYPETTGEHLYTVYAPPHHKESNRENNKQHVLVQIGRDKISVLHIAGAVTWDLNGLRAMFERNPMVDLTAFYIMRTREHAQHGIDGRSIMPEEMALVPFPTEEIFDRQLFGFDVIVFQDFDAGNYFSDSYQARRLMNKIKDFIVEHHGGLIVIGGPKMAAGPSLSLSPLADTLPIQPPVYRTPYVDNAVVGKATKLGKTHPLLRYFDNQTDVFRGYMDKVNTHKQARVLLRADNDTPLMATMENGNGRVVFLNTSSSWEWLRQDIAAGGTGDRYHGFWDDLLAWSTQHPSMNQVRMTATKSTNRPLDLDVSVELRDQDYVPQPGIESELELVSVSQPDQSYSASFQTNPSGEGQAKFKVGEPGYYRLHFAEKPWAELAAEQIVFLGGSQDEFRNQEPVAETLERLSSLSGGSFQDLDHFDPASLDWSREQTKQIEEIRRLKLRNWIWSLPLLIMIAGLEWYLRRSSHLA